LWVQQQGTNLHAEQNKCGQTTPAVDTVKVRDVIVVVELKHCCQACNKYTLFIQTNLI